MHAWRHNDVIFPNAFQVNIPGDIPDDGFEISSKQNRTKQFKS